MSDHTFAAGAAGHPAAQPDLVREARYILESLPVPRLGETDPGSGELLRRLVVWHLAWDEITTEIGVQSGPLAWPSDPLSVLMQMGNGVQSVLHRFRNGDLRIILDSIPAIFQRAMNAVSPGRRLDAEANRRRATQTVHFAIDYLAHGHTEGVLDLPLRDLFRPISGILAACIEALRNVLAPDSERAQLLQDLASVASAADLMSLARELGQEETRIQQTTENCEAKVAPSITPPALPLLPNTYLMSWLEILDALNLSYNDESRRRVRELNEQFDGPITLPGRGGQPKANKNALLLWWNGLEQRFQESKQENADAGADADATLRARHEYGRNGTVLPDINGHVQKRRGKKSGR